MVELQHAEGSARLTATVSRRTRVKDPDSVPGLVERYVRVPEYDHLSSREPPPEPVAASGRLSAVMQHRDVHA